MLGQSQSAWFKASRLEILITNSCDGSIHEPNFAHHLEIAEYINTKKGNAPREAAMIIAHLANHRNDHIALLALTLLGTLVQSCGYPFHLQIATKDFLNELVRRFPERPPPFPRPVMSRILELIHGWKEGICVESRWKEDLGNIRDMHRLLTFKGYRFRELPRRNAAEPQMTLKTPEELENEDREAQSAKLQEHLRRGTPRDLAAAQELMKLLAGANPDAKPDYRAQALAELEKLQSKVVLLNEMLDNIDAERGERFAKGDAYDQVASILKAARPKLQKWVSDAEEEDAKSLSAFLEANDQINTALARFEAFQQGDIAAVVSIPTSIGPASAGGSNDMSLIDLDDGPLNPEAGTRVAVDDLATLFTSSQPQPQPLPPPVNNATRPITSSPTPMSTQTSDHWQVHQLGSIQLPGTPKPPPMSNGGTRPAGSNAVGSIIDPISSPRPSNSSAAQPTSAMNAASLSQPQPRPASENSMQDPFAGLVELF